MHAIIVDTTMTTPPTGGSHTFLIDLCASLNKNGWSASFVAQPGPERGIVNGLKKLGADVHERIWREMDLPEERAERLAAWVNSMCPDVYIISTSPDAGWLALPLLNPLIPTVSIAHNDVSAYYEPLKHYSAFIDQSVSVSEEIQRKIVEDCAIPPERTARIPYGVHSLTEGEAHARACASTVKENALKLGYIGRVVTLQKRVLEIVPLVAELTRRQVDFEFHIIGDGDARSELARQLVDHGIEKHIKFWGWLGPDDVRQRLSDLDVFVLLSEYEGLSVALLEAMAHALAPVVTRIKSGTGEIVEDGRGGFLVDIGDINAFADRIERLGQERQLLANMKLEAWKVSQKYTVERMANSYLECFEQAKRINRQRHSRQHSQLDYPVMPTCRSRYPYWLRKLKRGALVILGRARY
jgi:glycosyltransferase involved in cell wall biosynthesis